MLRHHHFLSAVTVALCATAGSFAFAAAAQNAPRPLQNAPAQNAPNNARDARLEGRLAYLKTELRITPAQTQAWDAYAAVIRNDRPDRVGARTNPAPGPRARLGLVDGLADRQQRLAAKSAQLDRIVAVLKPLYAAFSDDQRRMADRLLAPRNGPAVRAGMRLPPRFAWDPRFDPRFYR